MHKFIFLIPFFLFACKKNEPTPKITLRQQPGKIAVFSVDTGTGAQTLQYEINYFYNDSTKKFDSIVVAGNVYRFDYSQVSTNNKILLNYTSANAPYDEFIFDTNFYSLQAYNKIVSLSPPASNSNSGYIFQYNSGYKITGLTYNGPVGTYVGFAQTYLYQNDSVFVNTVNPSAGCQSTDSIANSFVNMSTTLPYLFFTDINNTCDSIELNILKALPVSNATNLFPSKIINGNIEIDFTYTGDSNSRLSQALIVTKERSSNLISQELKIVLTY